jgi:CBS domain containing-hemolysin-like protein
MLVVVLIVSLVLGALFAGSQVAYVSASRLRVEIRAREKGLRGKIAMSFVQDLSKLLTTTLVGSHIALVVFATALALILGPPLHLFFGVSVGLSEALTMILTLVVQTVIASIVIVFACEIVPKAVLREMPNRAVFPLALPLQILNVLLWPLIALAGLLARGLARLLGSEQRSLPTILRRDLEFLIEQQRGNGVLSLDDEGQTILSNVFAMDSIRVRESMIPRTEVDAVDDTTTIEELRNRFIESGFSKLPVYHENIDNIVGIAFAHDLFESPTVLADVMRPPRFVPASTSSKVLLRDFLDSSTSVAIVLDEFGGMAGIVTREDLLEELIGDIKDEFDTDDEVLRQLNSTTYLVSGRVYLHTLEAKFAVKLPDGDYETVAGYILDHLGRIPSQKEEFALGGFRFLIVRSTANRIDLVRIVRIELDEPLESDELIFPAP